jgi:secreted trypsin-like serine protease
MPLLVSDPVARTCGAGARRLASRLRSQESRPLATTTRGSRGGAKVFAAFCAGAPSCRAGWDSRPRHGAPGPSSARASRVQPQHAIRPLLTFAFATVVGLALGACTKVENAAEDGNSDQAVLGEEETTGYAAVGALTHLENERYYGSFCTGTLIDSTWVLTAAHCLKKCKWNCTPTTMRFYVGPDAAPTSDHGRPAKGRLYAIKRTITHPHYRATTQSNDIALLELKGPVPENVAKPFSLSGESLTNSSEGTETAAVGFGCSELDCIKMVKMSGKMPIEHVAADMYLARNDSVAPCFGDSGGPGLLSNSDVIGVVAGGNDNCTVGSDRVTRYNRVDAHLNWIRAVMADAGADSFACAASDHPECAGACQTADCAYQYMDEDTNGWTCGKGRVSVYDPSVCNVKSCAEINTCATQCTDPPCVEACWTDGTTDARIDSERIIDCAKRAVDNMTGGDGCPARCPSS